MNKRYFNFILGFLATQFVIAKSYALTIVQNAPPPASTQPSTILGMSSDMIIGAMIMGLGIGAVIGLIIFIIYKIIKHIQEAKKRANDLYYEKFKVDVKLANFNKDSLYKKRSWKLFFLGFKRNDVYLETSMGLKFIGYYDGEMIKKNDFLVLSVYTIKSLFVRENFLVVIPYNFKHILKKNSVKKAHYISIVAESLDEFGNSDYYFMPVIRDKTKSDSAFLDFSNFLVEKYLNQYVLKDVMKQNVVEFKELMEKAVEINPNIQVQRKNPSKPM